MPSQAQRQQEKQKARLRGSATTWARLPRPPNTPDGVMIQAGTPQPTPRGMGERSMWVLPPVGEAQQRDPHIPDPYAGGDQTGDQRDASPSVKTVNRTHPGGGIHSDGGLPNALLYVKHIGRMVTSTLAIATKQGIYESRWRTGGIGYPYFPGGTNGTQPGFAANVGVGYQGDSQTLWYDNPQTYLRNPGVIPLTNVPATWRYAPGGGIQALGPSIADVGTLVPTGGRTIR